MLMFGIDFYTISGCWCGVRFFLCLKCALTQKRLKNTGVEYGSPCPTCSARSVGWLRPLLLPGQPGNWTQYHLHQLLAFPPWCRANGYNDKEPRIANSVFIMQISWNETASVIALGRHATIGASDQKINIVQVKSLDKACKLWIIYTKIRE